MIVFDNIIFSLQRAGGISAMWQNVLSEADKLGVEYCTLEYPQAGENIFRRALSLRSGSAEQRTFRMSKTIEQMLDVPFRQMHLPFIFHSSYYRTCSHPKALNITTVHDFIYERRISHVGLAERIRIKLNHRAIRRSRQIICVSENTRRDLLHFLPDIDPKKVSVIYNGVSDEFHPLLDKISELSDCILFVGGRQDYKNFGFAIQVAKATELKLLICGNELTDKEKSLLESELGADGYSFSLRPDNKMLNRFYNSVHCLIYPSEYEGFGIPIIEAQKAGCPVIALNASSVPEIIDTQGKYPMLASANINSAIDLIDRFGEQEYREEIVARGLKNATRFSWRFAGLQYALLYSNLLHPEPQE